MKTTLHEEQRVLLCAELPAIQAPAALSPRPAHVLYGGAQRFSRNTVQKLSGLARDALVEHAQDASSLARLFQLDDELAARVHPRLVRKLEQGAIEDLRIDFEDGLGPVSDDEEDAHAVRAADELGAAHAAGELPPFVGIRVRALRGATATRALRTLDLFLSRARDVVAELPGFAVTLPKVEDPREVMVLVDTLSFLERELGLPAGSVALELMIESPSALLSSDGQLRARTFVDVGQRRVRSVHVGSYDLLSALDVTAAHQRGDHPAVELTRLLLKLSLAGTGVTVSDGATHVLPIGPQRASSGAALNERQRAHNRDVVTGALRLHAASIRAALACGIYQGWDLHPAQLLARWTTVLAFFLEDLDQQAGRLSAYLARAAAADRAGHVFDDAASAQGLLHTFLRGHAVGALNDDELRRAGVDDALRQAGSLAPLLARSSVSSSAAPDSSMARRPGGE